MIYYSISPFSFHEEERTVSGCGEQDVESQWVISDKALTSGSICMMQPIEHPQSCLRPIVPLERPILQDASGMGEVEGFIMERDAGSEASFQPFCRMYCSLWRGNSP